MELASYFKKDLRNQKYVCPKNLKAAHDVLVNNKQAIYRVHDEIRAAQNEQRRRENAIRQAEINRMNQEMDSSKYIQEKSKFFELAFVKDNLSITVLKNLKESQEEGEVYNHFVFTNDYFNKKIPSFFPLKSMVFALKQ
ncbi:hypothetical protein G6M26_20940 [Agrobacterium tumefaciens]|nr:hypothetical protein [Agrobacterium tumefaciens]NTE21005.1 hypothetical protein [Agrobacterium tumefaciens]